MHQYFLSRNNFLLMVAYLLVGHNEFVVACGDLTPLDSNEDIKACYAALDGLVKSSKTDEDVAFYFGYLSGRLEVKLPDHWKSAFLGRDFNSNELYRPKIVYAGGEELTKNIVSSLGIESFLSVREGYYNLVSDHKVERNEMCIASVFQAPSPFFIKCIDKGSKEVLWTREVLTRLRGFDPCGPDYHHVEFLDTEENIFVFGFSGTECYIYRIHAKTGEVTFEICSKTLMHIGK